MKSKNPFSYLSKFEWGLYITSLVVVTASFIIGGGCDALTLIASLIGVTALIFVAKGDVLGQLLTVVFALIYAVISYDLRYYGEMITYLGMTAPIAAASVITWLRNPYKKGGREVKAAVMSRGGIALMLLLTAAVTFVFYFILNYFGNASLGISTLSITTSFLASYLTMMRSPYYGLAYGANDIVLIILWVIASIDDISYLPMVVCFFMFLLNDVYGFYNWRRIMKRQRG
ncbi:MAG: nicotinamide mononucleotide transporter [Clostridia bacterium]|nr:nicotinamide mononucleotide transporter [Clostridia bacterium]